MFYCPFRYLVTGDFFLARVHGKTFRGNHHIGGKCAAVNSATQIAMTIDHAFDAPGCTVSHRCAAALPADAVQISYFQAMAMRYSIISLQRFTIAG